MKNLPQAADKNAKSKARTKEKMMMKKDELLVCVIKVLNGQSFDRSLAKSKHIQD